VALRTLIEDQIQVHGNYSLIKLPAHRSEKRPARLRTKSLRKLMRLLRFCQFIFARELRVDVEESAGLIWTIIFFLFFFEASPPSPSVRPCVIPHARQPIARARAGGGREVVMTHEKPHAEGIIGPSLANAELKLGTFAPRRRRIVSWRRDFRFLNFL
jgi:hypothetical protein